MKNENIARRSFWIHLAITILVGLMLLLLVNKYKDVQTNAYIKRLIEAELSEKDKEINQLIDGLIIDYQEDGPISSDERGVKLDKIGGMLYLFDKDSLVFWTSNSVDPEEIRNNLNHSVHKFSNGWYEIIYKKKENILVYGTLLIKNEFAFHNEYLISDFNSNAALSEDCKISLEKGELNIQDQNGEFLFSIRRENPQKIKPDHSSVLFLLYQGLIILILSLIIKFYKGFGYLIKRKWLIPLFILFDFLFIWIVLKYFKVPSLLFDSYLYSPTTFADFIHNSIGDLFTNTSFVIFYIYALNFFLPKTNNALKNKKIWQYVVLILAVFLFIGAFQIYESFLISLFQNSRLSIEFGMDFISERALTILAFLITAGLSLAMYLIGRCVLFLFINELFAKKVKIIIWFLILIIYITETYLFFEVRVASFILISILSYLFLLGNGRSMRLSTMHITSYILIFTLYLGFIATKVLTEKEIEHRKVIAESIANNRDPMSEFIFEKVIEQIYQDSTLKNDIYRLKDNWDQTKIIEKIKSYFVKQNSLKFVPYITICDDSKVESLLDPSKEVSCVEYFSEIISEYGIPTNHKDLFFLRNNSLNNSYVVRLFFPAVDHFPERHIYIALISEFIPEGLGYPELLIDESSNVSGSELINYSFAKYKNDGLVYKFGDYYYSMNLQNYKNYNTKGVSFDVNGYNHILIKKDAETTYIISKKSKDIIETIAPFSYFFIFIAIYLILFYFVTGFSYKIFKIQISFGNRLQFNLLGIILTSFIVIGFTTLLYLINLNDKKNHELLSEKAQSVLIELQDKLAGTDYISPEMYETLNLWLDKFSKVFFTDINLYSPEGRLIASSRLQIFDEGLLSNLMNVKAYDELANKEKLLFIQNEKIGNYQYLSAYVPYRNTQNKLIAYLNLPYFAKQTELQIEITTFLVALVNIYVLFFIVTLLITILISRKISKPLQLIRESISGIRLEKSNEKINWSREDEIGSLIKEYNRMIDELSDSAALLARSERESAWREMAKQVAHEIKNPLTPMKLSVQYLKKAWDEKEQGWEQRLNRFTKTIIEQIDSLSEIASAFSDFAKMPVQKPEPIDLKTIIKTAIALFNENSSIQFIFHFPDDECIINADKNQILRVFNNLIKNSIQAIGSKNNGLINISIEKSPKEIIISISDNGSGISQEMADKIFTPSFTTKTSGMGLGLAIIRNIILNTGGNIWFESEKNVGTTFFISFPFYNHQ